MQGVTRATASLLQLQAPQVTARKRSASLKARGLRPLPTWLQSQALPESILEAFEQREQGYETVHELVWSYIKEP